MENRKLSTNKFGWLNCKIQPTPRVNYDNIVCYNVTTMVGEAKDGIYLITTNNQDLTNVSLYWNNILLKTATAMQDDHKSHMQRHKNKYIIITETQLQILADRNKSIFKLWENKQEIPNDVKEKLEKDKQFPTLCEPLSKVEKKIFVPNNNLREKKQSEENKTSKKRGATVGSPKIAKQPKINPPVAPIAFPAVPAIPPITELDASLLLGFSNATGGDHTLFGANNAASSAFKEQQTVIQQETSCHPERSEGSHGKFHK